MIESRALVAARRGHRRSPRGWMLPQQDRQHAAVDDTEEAEPLERVLPREAAGGSGPEPAERLPDVQAGHVDADSQRSRGALMIVGDEREAGGDVQRLAHTHDRPQHVQRVEVVRVAHPERDDGPDAEAGRDQPLPVDAVRDQPCDRAHQPVDPQEHGHQPAEVLRALQPADVAHHRGLHRGEHLPVEIVEQGDAPEKRDDQPGVPRRRPAVPGAAGVRQGHCAAPDRPTRPCLIPSAIRQQTSCWRGRWKQPL